MSTPRYGITEPRVWTKPLVELTPETSRGFAVIKFAHDDLGVRLLPWQEWLPIHMLELDSFGLLRFRKALVIVGRQNGKTAIAQGWLALLAGRNGGTYVNYGINGTYMTNRLYNDQQGVVDRYQAMDNDADYVLVFAGTNDAAAGVALGSATSTDPAEFNGALNVLIPGLITKYPGRRSGSSPRTGATRTTRRTSTRSRRGAPSTASPSSTTS